MRYVSILLIALGWTAALRAGEEAPAPPPGQDPGADATAFLEKARASWFSASREGMTSVTADASLDAEDSVPSGNRRLKPWQEMKFSNLDALYAWSEAAGQEINLTGEMDRRRRMQMEKQVRKYLDAVWRGIAGSPFGPFPEGLTPALSEEEGDRVVTFKKRETTVLRLRFSATTGLPFTMEETRGKRRTTWTFRFSTVEEKRVLSGLSIVSEAGDKILEDTGISWERFVLVNEMPLPVAVKLDCKGRSFALRLTYRDVNGEPAEVKTGGKEAVKDLAKWLSTAFSSGGILEKEQAIETALDMGTEHAAQLLVRYVYDREAGVSVAKALGKMGKGGAVPGLISALSRARSRTDLHLMVIWALGEIGDPRAVPALSKNIWSGCGTAGWKEPAVARVEALGHIRHATAVDELIDLTEDTRRRWGHALRQHAFKALRDLTGQRLPNNPRAWKDWWKENRRTFRF